MYNFKKVVISVLQILNIINCKQVTPWQIQVFQRLFGLYKETSPHNKALFTAFTLCLLGFASTPVQPPGLPTYCILEIFYHHPASPTWVFFYVLFEDKFPFATKHIKTIFKKHTK